MLGAIIGDIVGSVYEFDNIKTTDFPLFSQRSTFTDDSIMTIAVAEWLITDHQHTHESLESIMLRYAEDHKSQMGGFGGRFGQWLFSPENMIDYRTGELAGKRVPYNSWGNGAAMRASAVGWKYQTLEQTEEVAAISASITHDHPEGIKGAQATAAAIWMARNGKSKAEIKDYIEQRFGYDLGTHTDVIRKTYGWESSCQGTVPPAIRAFLDSRDFESAVRIAVSLGGDSDTLACITGGIAEAYYGEIPREISQRAIDLLPESFQYMLKAFRQRSYYWQKTARPEEKSRKFTPEKISFLEPNEIFVFGSNLQGKHIGGAAATAVKSFGAIWGQGVGIQGQCYAIPTMHGGVDAIRPYVDEFIEYAKEYPQFTFLVTRIGCGIAGFKDCEIAPLFVDTLTLPNVRLPKSFNDIILGSLCMSEETQLPWDVEWFEELTPDIPLNERQYEIFCRGYFPGWDCRYAPIKIGNWHYVVRSGYWLKKYRYEKQDDGLYHLIESYTSRKEIGRNLLMECMTYGDFRPSILEHEYIKEYIDMYSDYSESHLTIVTDGRPARCLRCENEFLKEVIYGMPSGKVDLDKVVLGGCCINEYSHNWECPECHARYKSFDFFE